LLSKNDKLNLLHKLNPSTISLPKPFSFIFIFIIQDGLFCNLHCSLVYRTWGAFTKTYWGGGGGLMRKWGCLKILSCEKGVSEKLNSCQGGYLKKEENETQN